MKLREVLLHKTKVGDFVVIYDQGFYAGCTIIDYEDLFIHSLDPAFLKREVKNYKRDNKDWYAHPSRETVVVNLV